jgi:hypothetical protein
MMTPASHLSSGLKYLALTLIMPIALVGSYAQQSGLIDK